MFTMGEYSSIILHWNTFKNLTLQCDYYTKKILGEQAWTISTSKGNFNWLQALILKPIPPLLWAKCTLFDERLNQKLGLETPKGGLPNQYLGW